MHRPVMLEESVAALNVRADSIIVDATLGGGGHSREILAALGPRGVLIGLDQDPDAVQRIAALPYGDDERLRLVHSNFRHIREVVENLGYSRVDGVIMDLGLSSYQIADAQRGFSFQTAGPLDMRMDPGADLTAEDIVNHYSEEDIARIIWELGEERHSRRIASVIAGERRKNRISDTSHLADIIVSAKPGRRGRINPATKTFMALRMAVNDEIGALKAALSGSLELLAENGRLVVISFHSLEDRVVKRFFRKHRGYEESLQGGGSRWRRAEPPVRLITRKPLLATENEVRANPRARSAKMRVAERCS